MSFSTDHNYKFWQTEQRARKFKVMHGLQAPESAIFSRIDQQFENPVILDLGVGAGRTTAALVAVAGDYCGLDYSPVMVKICEERFPGVTFKLGDARTLEGVETGSQDVVVFSYNGIDCVGEDDRHAVFEAVHRVLKPGGLLVHSSHNLDYVGLPQLRNPYSLTRLKGQLGHAALGRRIYLYVVGIFSSISLRRRQIFGDGWAVLNEQTNRFRELMYYVTSDCQRRQLRDHGFRLDDMYSTDGAVISGTARHVHSPWIYYVSVKE